MCVCVQQILLKKKGERKRIAWKITLFTHTKFLTHVYANQCITRQIISEPFLRTIQIVHTFTHVYSYHYSSLRAQFAFGIIFSFPSSFVFLTYTYTYLSSKFERITPLFFFRSRRITLFFFWVQGVGVAPSMLVGEGHGSSTRMDRT